MSKKLILLRHAERPEIPEGEVGNELSITDQGRTDTVLLSRKFENVIGISSSPILRCLQTAEIIAETSGLDKTHINKSIDLGDPGFFIADASAAWDSWQKYGSIGVNKRLLSGKTDGWKGFKPLEQASRSFSHLILNKLQSCDEGTHLWVTHDTILAAFASWALPNNLTLDSWPNYLGYLEMELHISGELVYSYNM